MFQKVSMDDLNGSNIADHNDYRKRIDKIIVFGDFNLEPNEKNFKEMSKSFKWAINKEDHGYSTVEGTKQNLFDNIFISNFGLYDNSIKYLN